MSRIKNVLRYLIYPMATLNISYTNAILRLKTSSDKPRGTKTRSPNFSHDIGKSSYTIHLHQSILKKVSLMTKRSLGKRRWHESATLVCDTFLDSAGPGNVQFFLFRSVTRGVEENRINREERKKKEETTEKKDQLKWEQLGETSSWIHGICCNKYKLFEPNTLKIHFPLRTE